MQGEPTCEKRDFLAWVRKPSSSKRLTVGAGDVLVAKVSVRFAHCTGLAMRRYTSGRSIFMTNLGFRRHGSWIPMRQRVHAAMAAGPL